MPKHNNIASFLEAYIQTRDKRPYEFGEPVSEGLHLAGIVVSPCDSDAKKTAIITADGVKTIDGVVVGRGVHVALAFVSEHGESFLREYHFHKGDVFTKDIPAKKDLNLQALHLDGQDFDIYRS